MTANNEDELDSRFLLGRYRVVRKLGEGGMGTVHLARVEGAEGFTRPVVVKRMRSDIKSTEEGNRLFIREAKILSKMQHPSIVNIIDFGIEETAHIMVLEYVHGYTLAPWLDYRYSKQLPLPVDICLFVVRRVLDALHYAHNFDTEEGQEVEIVHRDVAPDNVLLSKKGYVHLLDFGVASMSGPDRGNSTKAGVFRGKLGYAAPETVHGEAATPRSDLYSAAVLLLELLVQETPFLSDSMGETVQRMVNEIPDPPSKTRDDIPEGLDEALQRALSKDPKERFKSAQAFARVLRSFQSEDDEEVAVRLKNIVSADFEMLPDEVGVEALREREEALARKLPEGVKVRPFESVVAADELPTAPGIPVGEMQPVPTGESQTGQRQLRGLLTGLLIVGGLIALGLGAAVALLSRSGTGEQVVVVGSDNDGAQIPGVSDASVPAEEADSLPPETSPAENTAPKLASRAKPMTQQRKLSRAVQKKSGAFQSCFMKHLDMARKNPTATLHFSVPAEGGKAEVGVGPSTLGSSPLGGCLKTAAAQVTFPRFDEPVSFSLPVKAHVSKR